MAKKNPYGTSALGQEGSGLAQVFQPYDASKYEQMLITQKQKEEADKQKTLKDLKLQNVPIPDTKEYWTKLGTGEYYQKWYDIMQDATKQAGELFYKANLDVSDNKGESHNKYYQASQVAKILKEQYNEDAIKSLYLRGIYDSERKKFVENEKNYDIEKTEANFDKFNAYVAYLQSRKIDANSKLDLGQKSADFYENVLGGSFLVAEFDYNAFKTNIQSGLKIEQKVTGGVYPSKTGGYRGVGKTISKKSDVKEATESVINAVTANTQALKYYRENTEYEDGLLSYFNEGRKEADKMLLTAEQLALQPLRGNYDKTVEKYFRNNEEAQQQLYEEYKIGDEITSSLSAIQDGSGGVGRLKTDDNGNMVTYNTTTDTRQFVDIMGMNLFKNLKTFKQFENTKNEKPEFYETKVYGAIAIGKNNWVYSNISAPENALYVKESNDGEPSVFNSDDISEAFGNNQITPQGAGSAYAGIYANWNGKEVTKTIETKSGVKLTINKYEVLPDAWQEYFKKHPEHGIIVEAGILTVNRIVGTTANKGETTSMVLPLDENTWLTKEQSDALKEDEQKFLERIGGNSAFDESSYR